MKGRARLLLGFAALLAVGGGVAIVRARSEPRRPPLVLADLRQPATSLAFVALDLGCFRRQGLAVEERTFELGRDALAALARGNVDVAVAFETPVLRSYLVDPRLRVLATLHNSTRNTRLVARLDAGVKTASDLRGRRVGVARGTNAEFFLATLLTFAGVGAGELTVVNNDPDALPEALGRGDVEAAVLSDPAAARARAVLGANVIEIETPLYEEFSLLTTRADVVESRRDDLKRLLRALLCAEDAAREGRPEAFEAVRARFPNRTEPELRDALARVARVVTVDGLLVAVLRSEADWLWSADTRGWLPDVAWLVDASLLSEVEPEAVNIPVGP